MKTVRILKMINPTPEIRSNLDALMQKFSSAKRYAFNRLLEGYEPNDLNKTIPVMFRLNKRYAEDAIMLAKGIIESQKKLLPLHLEDARAKIVKTQKKIKAYETGKKRPKKCDLSTCLTGLNNRLNKLLAKEQVLQDHIEKDTIPSVIFGGKRNFFARMKGKITNEKWKDLRSNQLYSRGDKTKKGNLNIRLVYENDKTYIQIADPLHMTGSGRSPRIKAEVKLPEKYLNEIADIFLPDENGICTPYTIQLKRKEGEYYLHLTYEEETPGKELKWDGALNTDLIAGIDTNIDRVAVTILTRQGNFKKSKVFYCHEMEYVSSNKRDNLSGELAKEIINFLLTENVGAVVLENLKFAQNHDTNKKFNRLTHNFTRNKTVNNIVRRALRNGFQIKKVNPAYTSVIGRFKYSKRYGLSIHEAAALVIGRRGLMYDEKLPREVLAFVQKRIKPHLISLVGSMEETEKQSDAGKRKLKYFMILIKNIQHFKKHHLWKIWNVVNKTIEYKYYQLIIKEV